MTTQQALVRRLINEVLNGQDYSVLPGILHEDYLYRTPGEVLHGGDALSTLFAMYHGAFPDLHLEIDDMFGEGDKVATAFTLTGTHQGEMMGMPATGRHVSVHGIIHSRVQDGRIVEEWELVDLAALFEQLGAAGEA